MPIWWLYFTLYESGWYEIISPTHAFSNHDIKIGGQWTIWRAISIFKMACFWSNLHYIAHSSTRGFWTLTHAHGLMKYEEWLKLMLIVNYVKRNPNHVNILNFTFSARCERALRARRHLRTENFEMLKMTWFVLSFNSLVILSNFKFWRAHTRASWPLCDLWWHDLLTLDLKYMWYEYEWPLLMHHEDMMDNVISQNGAWMTSR